MAKDCLHALKFEEFAQLDFLAEVGSHVAGFGVNFGEKARFLELVASGGLSIFNE